MRTDSDPPATWTLAHGWHSASDRAALDLCAATLAGLGVHFVGTADVAGADAVKMHGFEIVEALRARTPPLADLRAVAAARGWDARLDGRARRFMSHGDAVVGIPMNLHRANCLWSHRATSARIDAAGLDLEAWLRQAATRIARPLAIGGDPWQVGILFEALALAVLGPHAYERAFVQLDAEVLGGPAMTGVLAQLRAWRDFVDDALIARPWRAQLAAVDAGAAAVMIMGDWVGAAPPPEVERLHVDGFRRENVFVVDFFVPLRRGDGALAERVAAAFTAPEFQARFSAAKGSTPAVVAAQPATAGVGGRIDAPSLTLDQCCGVATKTRLLEVVADHFVHRRDPARTAAALASAARP